MSNTATSGIWGPAPAGVDLSQNQNTNIVASVAVVMVIGLTAVTFRLFARLSRTGPGTGIDDYIILAALVSAFDDFSFLRVMLELRPFEQALGIGNAVCCLISIQWGGGKHLWVVTADEFVKLWQTTYAFVIIYINSSMFITLLFFS